MDLRCARQIAVLCLLFLLVSAGCRPHRPKKNPPPSQPSTTLPVTVNTRGITINWRQKTPKGKLERVLDLQAENGALERDTQTGKMNKANGTLYRNNEARARFVAPTVYASKDRKSVTASGGVKITSLAPTGTSITADKVTWRIPENKIIAEGHVSFEYRSPESGEMIASGGPFPHVTIDTELQRLHVP